LTTYGGAGNVQGMTNVYVGAGVRSHRLDGLGTKTLCGINVFKAAKNPASDGDPGCNRCFRALNRGAH
jgi:hypothetical protein